MKLSDYVCQYLEGITDTVFLLTGGGMMHLADSLGQSKLNAVCCHHEQTCAIAAEAFGRMKNTVGVAMVTTGPGGTNAMTGVAGAWLDSIPMLVISGQVKTDNIAPRISGVPSVRSIGFQELNVIDMVKPITKYAVTIYDPLTIRYELEKAVHIAQTGRPGPVWIEIPLDISAADINLSDLRSFHPSFDEKSDFQNTHLPLTLIKKELEKAKRPLLLVGNGVRLSGAQKELMLFLKKTNMNVVTTIYTSDDLVTYDYSHYLGRQGITGNESANRAIDTCDLLLVIGERLQLTQTSYDYANFATQATKIMVDIDAAELHKKTIQIDIPVHMDAKEFLQKLIKEKITIKEWRVKSKPVPWKEYPSPSGKVNVYRAMEELSILLQKYDHHVTTSDGMASLAPHQALRVKPGQRFLTNAGLGEMGSGLPFAIGCAFADPSKPVICMEGDGSLMLNIQDLQTIIHHKLPIKLFIWNNEGYFSIRQSHKNYFKRLFASDKNTGVSFPDYQTLISAWGLPYVRIENDSELEKMATVLKSKGPIVCELCIDPDQPMLPKWTAGMYRNS